MKETINKNTLLKLISDRKKDVIAKREAMPPAKELDSIEEVIAFYMLLAREIELDELEKIIG